MKRIDEHLEFCSKSHKFKLDGREVPSITQCLVAAGLIDTAWFTDYSRDRGSAVHRACHYLDENDLAPDYLDGDQAGYLDAWELFCRQHGCKWESIERPVYSIMLQIAGIPDRIGTVDGKDCVVEIKTGLVSPVHGVQLAMQARIARPEKIMDRIAVQIRSDGNYRMTRFTSRDDYRVAMAAITITHWKRWNK
jgi:hypothetical protein